jgi:hypothetical protein
MDEKSLIYEIENFRLWEDHNPIIIIGERTLKRMNLYPKFMVEQRSESMQCSFYGCIIETSKYFNYGFILR